MSGGKEVPWHTCRGQSTVCRSRFSPFIMFPGTHLTWHTWQKPPLTQGAVLLTLKFTSNINRALPPLSKKLPNTTKTHSVASGCRGVSILTSQAFHDVQGVLAEIKCH